ncbi:replication initiator protein [Microviridae sp.]|nr:replication initiator protein [Microviridae sp.]
MHEASLHEENCFLTLTYDDDHLPYGGTLVKSDFQKFMKRLRKKFSGERIRYYHCGEYGEKGQRPHYHACIFGFDFRDKVQWSVRKGFPVWRSDVLEALWPLGNSEIGSLTFDSAAYCARYILKKVTGFEAEYFYSEYDSETGELFERLPEYTTMSRRPGIGAEWYRKFRDEVFPYDEVIVNGRPVRPPRFYGDLYELESPEGASEVRKRRQRSRRRDEETWERLLVRQVCDEARISLKERGLG